MGSSKDLNELRNLFVKWDTNNDGYLSPQELRSNMAEMEQYFNLREDQILKMINAADTNQDGKVDYTEFLTAAFDRQKLLSEPNLVKAFNIFD